jgi:soluble lytic murein transglycosylase-like protein
MDLSLIALITLYATTHGVDPNVAVSIAKVESNFNMKAVGTKGERGIYQLLPKAFPQYTVKELSQLEKNVEIGVKHLAYSNKRCSHKSNLDWVICYNRGVKGGSRVQNPSKDNYVRKVKTEYAKVKKRKQTIVAQFN